MVSIVSFTNNLLLNILFQLKEQLIHRLEQPYSKKEHDKLSKWIKKKMPICRHLDLRDRPMSVAVDGAVKSVLDDGPGKLNCDPLLLTI